MNRRALLAASLLLLSSCSLCLDFPPENARADSHAKVGAQLPISQWPVPASGSPDITAGDAFVGTRSGVSYKLLAGFGGSCATNTWVSAINTQGVPSCTQPAISGLSGYLNLDQIAGTYSNGQLLIGNTSTGQLQAATLSAGTNMAVTNSGGGVTLATTATPVFTSETVNGLATENGAISNGTTFAVASGCGTTGAPVGGATAGTFTSGATSCNPVMTLPAATHGWSCSWKDITTTADSIKQSAYSTTSCTGTGTVGNGDTIVFTADKGF